MTGDVILAERVGFEPTVAKATHALQACLIGHSSTSPYSFLVSGAGEYLSVLSANSCQVTEHVFWNVT